VAIVLGVVAMCAAPLALGRAADMNVSDGSGQERIQIWGEGLAALKSPAILFGIGEGQFEEVAYHVAHNSYIHAFVELGLFGGTLFFGCYLLPIWGLYLIIRHRLPIRDPELLRLLPFIAAIVVSWSVGIATLSRCYTASSYMIAGLCAAYLNLCGFHQPRPRPILQFNQQTAQRWLACSCGLLMASFLFVRLFARWGGA
jgi:O-antigen ligase